MSTLKTKFYKDVPTASLKGIKTSVYKNTIVERFIKITQNWLVSKLTLINEVLLPYDGLEFHGFYDLTEIKAIAFEGNYKDEISIDNLVIQLKKMVHETVCKSLKKVDMQINYDIQIGIITVTYAR